MDGRRWAVDDDRSRSKWAFDEDRRRLRCAVEEDRRRRRWVFDDDRRRRRREVDDYPPLQLPLQWRDPPPHYPHEDSHRRRRRPVDIDRRLKDLRAAQIETSLDRIDALFSYFNRSLERITASANKLSSDIYKYSLRHSPPHPANGHPAGDRDPTGANVPCDERDPVTGIRSMIPSLMNFACNQTQLMDQNTSPNREIWQLRDISDEADDVIDDLEYTRPEEQLDKNMEVVQKLDKVSAEVKTFLPPSSPPLGFTNLMSENSHLGEIAHLIEVCDGPDALIDAEMNANDVEIVT